MAKLVQKSGYIKSEKAGGYMKYIATREGVEKLTGNGPVTKGQRELIQKLLHDFPDAVELFEYEDYRKAPTLGTASAFITMALDANLHEINSESGYLSYIATRPRVERRGAHGLFSSAAAVDLDAAMSELEAHDGNVWTIIYSLRREDAARLGYDNAYAHKEIAFEFASWISVEFKLYLVKEFERLKTVEMKQLGWDIKRNLAKINYRIHTDAIKENLIPPELSAKQVSMVYASEADVLNMALFGMTAKQWRDTHPDLKGNIRDYANVSQLVCLSNMENLNAVFIGEGMSQAERLAKLNAIAISQMEILTQDHRIEALEAHSGEPSPME